MDTQWASENLQVIRTLMERAALYRRALAPLMLVAGLIGLGGAALGCVIPILGQRNFGLYWGGISAATFTVALVLVRRQAWQAQEPYWSPPTRRVARALAPPFICGLAGGILWVWLDERMTLPPTALSVMWLLCYGCGLHAAGFFMVRGIRLFGWIFVLGGIALGLCLFQFSGLRQPAAGHTVMGLFFGLFHLAYGLYLYYSEPRRNPS